jgi:hypothetical protein
LITVLADRPTATVIRTVGPLTLGLSAVAFCILLDIGAVRVFALFVETLPHRVCRIEDVNLLLQPMAHLVVHMQFVDGVLARAVAIPSGVWQNATIFFKLWAWFDGSLREHVQASALLNVILIMTKELLSALLMLHTIAWGRATGISDLLRLLALFKHQD